MTLSRVLTLSLLAVAACGNPTDVIDPPVPPIVNPPETAKKATVNIVHASPDAPAVDVYLNGKVAVSALGFRKGTGNVTVDAGDYKVELRPAGAAATTAAVYSVNLSLAKDSRTLVVAQGRLSDAADSPTAFRLTPLPFGTKDAGAVQLRLIHSSPSAPVVDLAAGSSNLVNDVKFGEASPFAKLQSDVAPATELGVRPGDAAVDLAFVVTPNATLPKGTTLSAIAFGEITPLVADDRFFAVSAVNEDSGQLVDLTVRLNDKGPKASFYVLHASPDAPGVDVVTKTGDKLVTDLRFRNVSTKLQVSAGVYPVEVRVAGQPTVVLSTNVKLLPALSWGLVATGLAAGTAPADRKLVLAALASPPKGQSGTKLRVVHTSPDAPAVDIASGTSKLVSNLKYLQATSYLDFATGIPAGTLKVRAAGQPKDLYDIVIDNTVGPATLGQNVSVFATGQVATTPATFQAIAVVETADRPAVVALPTTPSK